MTKPQKYKINSKFHKILQGEDDIGVVIRTHIQIEQHLNELLKLLCRDFNALEENTRLVYSQKVYLAEALEINADYGKFLRALGKIRNEFAHKADMKIDKSNTSSLYDALSSELKRNLQNIYDETRKLNKNKINKSLKKLEPRDKFILLAVAMQSSLQGLIAFKKESLVKGELKYHCECGEVNQLLLPKDFNKKSPRGISWNCPQCNKGYEFEYNFIKHE